MRSAFCTSLILISVAACGGGGDGRGDGSTTAIRSDSGADSARGLFLPRLARDGTLTLFTMSPLTATLRMAADSFSAREAVRVILDTVPAFDTGTAAGSKVGTADVVALSTTLLAERLLTPGLASWSLPFARNRVVLAWTDSSRRAAEIDSASWRREVARRDTRIGRADPESTPLGVHTLLAMQLAQTFLAERGLAARLQSARTYPSSDSMVAALRAERLDVIWTYESVARASGLRWLNLGPQVDLGDGARATSYAAASALLLRRVAPDTAAPQDTAGRRDSSATRAIVVDSLIVIGTPLEYAVSIPRQSGNLALAERFVRFLFSPMGQRILRRGAFDLIDPLVVSGEAVPGTVAVIADSVARVDHDSGGMPIRRP